MAEFLTQQFCPLMQVCGQMRLDFTSLFYTLYRPVVSDFDKISELLSSGLSDRPCAGHWKL